MAGVWSVRSSLQCIITRILTDPWSEDLALGSKTTAESPLYYAVEEASCDTSDILLNQSLIFISPK
jgi:hypothetical protein